MIDFFSETFLTAFIVAVLASAIPLLLASIGETVGEQSGVLNIGMEGLMLVGGYFGFVGTLVSGSFWVGFLSGAAAGIALSMVMMVLCVWLGLNQIVVGIGIGLAGAGVSSVLYDFQFAESKPRLGLDTPWTIPFLSDLPVVGKGLFAQPGMFYVSLIILVLTSIWLYKTTPGLRLRSAGQKPASLDAAGGSVMRTRSLAVLFGGAMSGLGGAYLALISAGTFTPGMTNGVGFLAIVVAMLARGRFTWVLLISIVYGLFVAMGTVLQLTTLNIPNDVVHMMPFVAVMIVLTFFARRSALPPALATAYVRGAR
ncbi:ABC transporter permease [Leucobacter denitrificans]|uniref:ABC transporter permease n=1 Tax=Leucobacter denitrificans TaxID=683042 RepID=A0A7G9S393_9MICO|nr:ABC transporter permease [Leucobacter denitrificans]QNN62318.1 ABC transporter permease [Leucobacter denitrificans]